MTKAKTPGANHDADRIGHAGQAAWTRLKKNKDWNDWMAVGEALLVGREVSMRGAGTNRPEGRGYNELFSQWLARYKLNEMDKSARAKLLQVMTHRMEIETYRASLTVWERMKLNHPTTMLRHWQKATVVPKPKKPKPDELTSLQAHVEELEAGREPLTLEGARKAYAVLLFDLSLEEVMAEIEQLKADVGIKLAEDSLTMIDRKLEEFP